MTNQTIDGVLVSRELLDKVCNGYAQEQGHALNELRALLDESVKWVPTIAQIRLRRPESNCPNFGPWHDLSMSRYEKDRTSYIDSAGWECETRLLYRQVIKS